MIDRKKFFAGVKDRIDPTLTQAQVDGLNAILEGFETHNEWLADIRLAAYALATIFHETAGTFQPIHEYGSRDYFNKRYGSNTKVGRSLGNTKPGDGARYAGRGYVQLTGRKNYAKYGLEDRPDDAMQPTEAFNILTQGMFHGGFTGKKLSDYINSDKTDYVNARRIINGTDKAGLIAGYAKSFEKILKDSAAAPSESSNKGASDTSKANSTPQDGQPPTSADKVETPTSGMPQPAAPPKVTEQTTDVQVSQDGTTAVTANTKVGGLKWLMTAIIAIVTGQATVPEFVNNGIQSPSFWTVVLNIFQNLWTFKVYIIGAILVIFIVRKLETTVLKVAAMRLNADDTKGNVVLTKSVASEGWFNSIRKKVGI